MSRRCGACLHPERQTIDRALVRGASYRGIARQHGLSPDAVERHAAKHLPRALTKAQQVRDMVAADDLAGQVRVLIEQGWAILAEARDRGQHTVALAAIDRLTRTLELLGKLMGELASAPTVSLLVHPDWLVLKARLLVALDPYPDARGAVARALLPPGESGGDGADAGA